MALSSTVMFKFLCTTKESFLMQCYRRFPYKKKIVVRFFLLLPTLKLEEGHPLSAIRNSFSIFAVTLHPQIKKASCYGNKYLDI